MTRCTKFHHLYDEVGNFCGMSATSISYYKAYREHVKRIILAGKLDEDFVFEHFTESPSRLITKLDDDTKTKALNYVVGRLKEGETITEGDIKASIKVWQGGSCSTHARSENLTIVNKGVQSEPEIKKGIQFEKVSDAPPQPSLADQLKDLPPLSPDADISERLKRDEVLLARMAATKPGFLDPGDTAFSRASNPPLPKTETRWGAGKILTREEKMRVLCTQILIPKQVAVLRMLVKSGEVEDELMALDLLIDEAQDRMGGA